MLRINLLPAYIAERQKVRNAIIGSVIGFLLVVGGLLGWQFLSLQPALETRTQEATDMQTKADAETAYEAQTATIRTGIKPLQEKVDFVKFVQYYNTLRPRIYRNAATYTYRDVEYNSMSVSGNTLAINGYVKNLADLGRFYLTFYGNPDVTAVSISGIPSWPAGTGGAQGPNPQVPGQPIPAALRSFPVALTATLAKPISPPALPASLLSSAGGAGGAGGAAPVGAPVGAPSPDAPGGPPRGGGPPP